MNYKAKEVAKFVVNYANNKGKFVNNTMVNIILYYLQGFSYIRYKEPLFQDDFEAWAYGPRIPKVYTLFSMFGTFFFTTRWKTLTIGKDLVRGLLIF